MRTPTEQERIETLNRYRLAIGHHRLCIDLALEPEPILEERRQAIKGLRRAYASAQGPIGGNA